jgi:hypothetical protein
MTDPAESVWVRRRRLVFHLRDLPYHLGNGLVCRPGSRIGEQSICQDFISHLRHCRRLYLYLCRIRGAGARNAVGTPSSTIGHLLFRMDRDGTAGCPIGGKRGPRRVPDHDGTVPA